MALTSPRVRSSLAGEVRSVAAGLRELVAGLEPREVPLAVAAEVLAAFVEVERVAASGRLLVTARAAEAGEWERARAGSPVEWLAALLGTSTGRAKAELVTSEQLGSLEATAGAVRAGLLSAEQAGVVADAASVNPGAESDLVAHAQRESLTRTKAEAERRKAEARSEDEVAARDARVRRERRVRCWYANGAGHLEAVGPVAAIKDMEAWINQQVDGRLRRKTAPTDREPAAALRFDALMGAADTAGAGPGESAGRRSKKTPVRRLTLVKVDLAALVRGHTWPGELCEIGGLPVSVAELRRTLGDSMLHLVLTNGDAVVDVVNLGRKPTVAQMLAKLFADSCCSVEGCDRAVRLEFDHRDDWVRTLTTRLASLDLVCDHHHRLKTFEGWALVAGSGRRAMVPPTDPRHPEYGKKQATAPPLVPVRRPEAVESAAPTRPRSATPAAAASSARLAELTERLDRIKAQDAAHRARRAGQRELFDSS